MRKKYIVFALILCLISSFAIAQNKKIDSLLSVLKIAKEDTNKVQSLLVLGGMLRNKTDEALKYCNEALVLAQKLNDKNREGKAYQNLSTLYSDKGDLAKSVENSNSALRVFEKINNWEGVAITHMNRGVTYGKARQNEEALKEYFIALKWFTENNRNDGIAFCANNISSTYSRTGKPHEAMKYNQIALKARKQNNDKSGIAMSLSNIGSLYESQGNYTAALDYFLQSLRIREEIGEKAGMAISYNNLGSCYFYQEKYPESATYFTKSMKIWEELGNKKGVADGYNNLGSIYTKQSKIEDAIKMHQQALDIRKKAGDQYGIAASYHNIGATYNENAQYEEALKNSFLSVEIKEKINDKPGLSLSYLNIGKIYTKLNKTAEAKKYINKSMELSREMGNKETLMEIYASLSHLDSLTGDFKSAHENYKKYVLYNDSIDNKETTEQITRLQMQFDFEKKEDSLNYQQALTNEKLKQQTLLTQQQQQQLIIKMNEIALISKQKELHELDYLKTQAELQAEQSKRKENDALLIIAKHEKSLQNAKIALQASQLGLQNKQIQEKKTQRNILIGGVIASLLVAFLIFRNFKNQKKANQLIKVSADKERIELQLQSLRAQLNPHFMFNSLNAIQELILKQENEKSQAYLERFAKLLRILLENANDPFISLEKEINLVELYLSLEKLRIPDLQYHIEIDSNIDPKKVITPNMMLQPYVENALWHGLQHKTGDKNLLLNICRQNGSLRYEIKDNGIGRKKSEDLKTIYRKEHKSKGMELLNQRFNLLSKEYGQNIQTDIVDLNDGKTPTGTLVKITIPYVDNSNNSLS